MNTIYLDIHIHTSDNPDSLTHNYDIEALKRGIESIAGGNNYLVSLTDHNVINEKIYLQAVTDLANLILGVELHIRNYPEAPPYHCHLLFNLEEINADNIRKINRILDQLYPIRKRVTDSDNIPRLQDIMDKFDEYEFLLLPHGGQNHSTFDDSIPNGVKFDKTLERNIYYNHFDGFTSRGNKGIEKTQKYFSRLGIKEFVHLVTGTDNYNPLFYPQCKAGKDASEFIPTWMLARPTFDGLRLSLSESSRLKYGEKPDVWSEYIRGARLKVANIDIDVSFTAGLNVVIGGSSSGKSLLVDSIVRSIRKDFSESVYINTDYPVKDIIVDNPTGQHPHYFDQSYISRICDPRDKQNEIQDISILKSIFPSDSEERETITNAQSKLAQHLSKMMHSVREISSVYDDLIRIPVISSLIISGDIDANPVKPLEPSPGATDSIDYSQALFNHHMETLDQMDMFLKEHPILRREKASIDVLKRSLQKSRLISIMNAQVLNIIRKTIDEIDVEQTKKGKEKTTKRKQFEKLMGCIRTYAKAKIEFYTALREISNFTLMIETKKIQSMGHTLFIENKFELNKKMFLQVVNDMLRSGSTIQKFEDITPESLFESHFKKKLPKISGYDDFEYRIKEKFSDMNSKTYKIITKDGRDFSKLSAGWKTAVILDLILGWESDTATLVIDQPEDNLATTYINHGLISAIKDCKGKKQIILVSHNATIPMLGDAQNVILCTNEGGLILIRSDVLEGTIGGQKVVDHIAHITDGGKPSIKKRVKKYNLKDYKETPG
jgi:hypothetical protein